MSTLQGEHIYLRALEPEDIEVLFEIENTESLWNVGENTIPFSKSLLKKYLANAHKDIYEARQLRLVIAHLETNDFLGLVDLFDFEPHHQRAGVGVLIAKENARNKGYAYDAIDTLKKYTRHHLKLHQLHASIEEGNEASKALFEKLGFKQIGLKKDWRRIHAINGRERYANEFMYQYIFE